MKAIETTVSGVAAQNAIPEKKAFSIKESTKLSGDGSKTLFQLFQDQVAAITGLSDVLASGKAATLSLRIHVEAETNDLI